MSCVHATQLVVNNTFFELQLQDSSPTCTPSRSSSEPPRARPSRAAKGLQHLENAASSDRSSGTKETDAPSRLEPTPYFGSRGSAGSSGSDPTLELLPSNPHPAWQFEGPSCGPVSDGHASPTERDDTPDLLASGSSRSRPPISWGTRTPFPERQRQATPVALDQRTTVVIRNLPGECTRDRLMAMLDEEGFAAQYDFLYLPIHFGTASAFGHAFVNLTHPGVTPAFFERFHGYRCPWAYPGQRACSVSWSTTHQGLRAQVDRYRNSVVMRDDVPDEFRPVVLYKGMRVVFPPRTEDPERGDDEAPSRRGGAGAAGSTEKASLADERRRG